MQYLQYAENNIEVQNWVKTTLAKRLKKEPHTSQTEIEHILDFLKSDKAPARLSKMSYDTAKVQAEKWTKSLQKKGAHIVEGHKDVVKVKAFKESGLTLVRLKGKAAYEREGFLMRHCVASYFGKKESKIYSLRDKDNVPHATLEITGGEVQQIKGKGNGSIHPNYIDAVVYFLEKVAKLEVRSSEMQNLGYLAITQEYEKLAADVGQAITTKRIGKETYAYMGAK